MSKANLIFDIPDSAYSSNPKKGHTFGAVLQYPMNPKVNLRSGVNFIQKGLEDSQSFFGATIESRVNLSYISVPILIQYKIHTSANTPYIIGGVEAGILLRAKSVTIISGFPTDVGFIINGKTTMDIIDSLSAVDLTWNIGGGYERMIGDRKIFGELQFTFGLNDIDDVDEKIFVKSRGIIIAVGYIF